MGLASRVMQWMCKKVRSPGSVQVMIDNRLDGLLGIALQQTVRTDTVYTHTVVVLILHTHIHLYHSYTYFTH